MSPAPLRARLVNDTTAIALDIIAMGPDPITALRRRLLDAGLDPNLGLAVWRGSKVVQVIPRIGTDRVRARRKQESAA
jgi:hypothetical protein